MRRGKNERSKQSIGTIIVNVSQDISRVIVAFRYVVFPASASFLRPGQGCHVTPREISSSQLC